MAIPRGPVTDFLVVSNLLIWAALWVTGFDDVAIAHLGFVPALVGRAFASADILAIADALILRPIGSAFIHGGFTHVAFNMMILLFTGRFVEGRIGGRGMAILLLVGAYAAALAQFLADPSDIGTIIGASGASAAVFAAYMLFYSRPWATAMGPISPYWVRRLQLLALWAFINFALYFLTGSTGGIAIFAHMGGFVAGLFFATPLQNQRAVQRRR
jgi:membrane associated rhomboid family serine protease